MKKAKQEFPLWVKENPDICRFCAYEKRDGTSIIYCEKKKKNLNEDETCRKFKYDILKKELRRGHSSAIKHSPEEFEI